MKRFAKSLAIALIALLITLGAVWAYTALTSTGDVTVEENLSWVGSNTFSVSLYPQESDTVSLTLANASVIDMDVDLTSTVTPDTGAKGLTISLPNKLTVPGSGQIAFDVDIVAGKNAEPQAYTVEILIER